MKEWQEEWSNCSTYTLFVMGTWMVKKNKHPINLMTLFKDFWIYPTYIYILIDLYKNVEGFYIIVQCNFIVESGLKYLNPHPSVTLVQQNNVFG
jgi:hypothetical protein